MKFQVTFKDPDSLYDAINDALDNEEFNGLAEDELNAVKEIRRQSIAEDCQKWFEWGEYLTVEIDTEEETCTVVPNK